jgi:FXSXX-COOH protein
MPKKLSVPVRSAAMLAGIATLAGGGAAIAGAASASAAQLPDLSATSLTALQTNSSPVLTAAIGRVLAEQTTNRPLYNSFGN